MGFVKSFTVGMVGFVKSFTVGFVKSFTMGMVSFPVGTGLIAVGARLRGGSQWIGVGMWWLGEGFVEERCSGV